MIPSSRTLEVGKSEVEEMIEESHEDGGEEEPYYEFEWFGLTYSYSKAGYWFRIILVVVMATLTAAVMTAGGEGGAALVLAIGTGFAIGISLLLMMLYRR